MAPHKSTQVSRGFEKWAQMIYKTFILLLAHKTNMVSASHRKILSLLERTFCLEHFDTVISLICKKNCEKSYFIIIVNNVILLLDGPSHIQLNSNIVFYSSLFGIFAGGCECMCVFLI